jgi:hypothetical protein
MAKPTFANLYYSLSDAELFGIAEDWPSLVDDARLALRVELFDVDWNFMSLNPQTSRIYRHNIDSSVP